jgi:hypothetical protein
MELSKCENKAKFIKRGDYSTLIFGMFLIFWNFSASNFLKVESSNRRKLASFLTKFHERDCVKSVKLRDSLNCQECIFPTETASLLSC